MLNLECTKRYLNCGKNDTVKIDGSTAPKVKDLAVQRENNPNVRGSIDNYLAYYIKSHNT